MLESRAVRVEVPYHEGFPDGSYGFFLRCLTYSWKACESDLLLCTTASGEEIAAIDEQITGEGVVNYVINACNRGTTKLKVPLTESHFFSSNTEPLATERRGC